MADIPTDIIEGRVWCNRCHLSLPCASFYAADLAKVKVAKRSVCRECKKATYRAARARDPERFKTYQRNWRLQNPEKTRQFELASRAKRDKSHVSKVQRARWLRKKYGLTPEEYERLLAAQGGGCACCGAKSNRSGRRLFVDHDHATGAVRGLLCNPCNAGIGHLGDGILGVRRALDYLERFYARRTGPRINLLRFARG